MVQQIKSIVVVLDKNYPDTEHNNITVFKNGELASRLIMKAGDELTLRYIITVDGGLMNIEDDLSKR